MQILLAEDDMINQKLVLQLLNRWGIDVSLANDGYEAIAQMEKTRFNLLLMDLNMPGLDGQETTKIIRSRHDSYFRNIPILAFTASPMADSKEKAEKMGMNDFIGKPLNPEELHCKINHYILSPAIECRPLKIKFELYADGDADFKTELVLLMISNLRELEFASYKAYYTGDARLFQTITHKVKSTLILLDDQEFTCAVDDLKYTFTTGEKTPGLQQKINKFNYLAESIIKTLDKEMNVLKAAC
jgi:CheY-like chemotaxis protein